MGPLSTTDPWPEVGQPDLDEALRLLVAQGRKVRYVGRQQELLFRDGGAPEAYRLVDVWVVEVPGTEVQL